MADKIEQVGPDSTGRGDELNDANNTGDGKMSKSQLKKLEKKAEKNLKKDAHKQQQPQEQQDESEDCSTGRYGDFNPLFQQSEMDVPLKALNKSLVTNLPQAIWVRARIHNTRSQGKRCFIVLRQQNWLAQALIEVDDTAGISKQMMKFCNSLPRESIVSIKGLLSEVPTLLKSCTQNDVELKVERIYVVSEGETPLPMQLEDAMRPEVGGESSATPAEASAEAAGDRCGKVEIRVEQDTRLDNRVIDLRTPANQAIFRLEAGVCRLFREILEKQGFMEIHTPKMISAASEGGGNVFEVAYFERKAYLAQSPQFYKQMAIAADFDRVYTIGSVFRAEDSNTHRHLTEFIGLDLEMAFKSNYMEVVTLITNLFFDMFRGLQERYAAEIDAINRQYPAEKFEWCEPALILDFREAVEIMRKNGIRQPDVSNEEDLSTAEEKQLGKIIKQMHKTDFYVIKKYPLDVRPFYTMPDPDDAAFTNSYDMFMRGEEIMSGAQRIHKVALLTERARTCKKKVDLDKIQSYIDAFRYGCAPHAGGGIGLERVTMLFLGLNNIRKTSLFPRDPRRIAP